MKYAVLTMLAAMGCLGQTRDADFAKLAGRFFDEVVFRYDPVSGTSAGYHQYDKLLSSGTRAEIAAETAALHQWERDVQAFDPKGLSPGAAMDRDLVLSQIRSQLLAIETVKQWEKNPDVYSSGLTNAVFVIMSRKFAPAEERLKSVIAREKLAPATLQAARQNLRNPPEVFTEVAIEQIPGIVSFFEKDVPAAFQEVKDPALTAEFRKTNQSVIDALHSYETFLKTDLLPKSKGDFRLGAETYSRKLLYDEMIDIPLDRLLEIGYQDLRRNQAEFKRVAAQADAKKKPQQILDELVKDHPAAADLLPTMRSLLGGLRDFVETKHIVTIPGTTPPIVRETPPFMRALTSASMDTPGPFETVAREAFFNVTTPEPNWPAKQTEEYMEGFNRETNITTAIHEVYPGHYVQFQWIANARSQVRKLMACGSNAEGWAHYTEQMMLDEGYGGGDKKLRLGQLQDALLRDARYIAGIEMHTGKMTLQQATDFFVKEGYQVRPVAEKEAKRGTSDPTYLVYTLGKLEILKLREDYRKMKGAKFSLQEFHDAFLREGSPPIKITRRALLGNDTPVL
jgi:uncharacterized protein (DUF885 family)